MSNYLLDSPWLDENIDIKKWSVVTANPRFVEFGYGNLAELEHSKLAAFLTGNHPMSLRGYWNVDARRFLSSVHADQMRFRASEPKIDVYYDPSASEFRSIETDGSVRGNIDPCSESPCKLAILNLDPKLVFDLRFGFDPDDYRLPATRKRIIGMAKRFLRVSINPEIRYAYSPSYGVHMNSE